MKGKIAAELYRSLFLLGADHVLLGTVGSLVDGAPDDDVLDNLQAWNDATLQELKARTQSYEEHTLMLQQPLAVCQGLECIYVALWRQLHSI